jgi:hypothetical protein
MLHLIDKTRFEKTCLGKSPDKKIQINLNIVWPYFELDNGSYLLYIGELGIGLIFGEPEENLNIDYSDWTLKKKSNEIDKRYILNIMKKHCFLDHDFWKTCEKGTWELKNSRTGETIEFAIKVGGSDYYKITSIGYEEKLRTPIDVFELKLKDKFIQNICYGLRGNNS